MCFKAYRHHGIKSKIKNIVGKNNYFPWKGVGGGQSSIENSTQIIFKIFPFPKELDQNDPQLVPKHQGSHINVEMILRASQKMLVNCDLFSGFKTACLSDSEQKEDMSRVSSILSTQPAIVPQ